MDGVWDKRGDFLDGCLIVYAARMKKLEHIGSGHVGVARRGMAGGIGGDRKKRLSRRDAELVARKAIRRSFGRLRGELQRRHFGCRGRIHVAKSGRKKPIGTDNSVNPLLRSGIECCKGIPCLFNYALLFGEER